MYVHVLVEINDLKLLLCTPLIHSPGHPCWNWHHSAVAVASPVASLAQPGSAYKETPTNTTEQGTLVMYTL